MGNLSMQIIEGKKYLTVDEFAERLQSSRMTAYNYIHKGRVEAISIRGRWYILEDSFSTLFLPTKEKIRVRNIKKD